MLEKILETANQYKQGLDHVRSRRDRWLTKVPELTERLKGIADYLNANTTYKQGFFVDTLHAWNQEINGTSSQMPSVTFRSGEMPMLVRFKNSMGERREYMEQGFHISFSPTITGQVVVSLLPHYSDLNEKQPEYITLGIIDDPEQLTTDRVDEIISRGMEGAFHSSFTGVNEDPPPTQQGARVNPIGFKRYETTEKVK